MAIMTAQPKTDFYVYVLFDADGVPRYVGKGWLGRWNGHAQKPFVAASIAAFGDVPKVKVREQLSEYEAYSIEHALICSLGRAPDGPLVNRTDKGSGPNSRQVADWHASRPFEDRSAIAKKARATWRERTTPEQRSATGRANALAHGSEAISERSRRTRAAETPEEKSLRGRAGGLASATALTPEQRKGRRKGLTVYWENTTPDERRSIAKKTGLGRAAASDLSAWGKRGATSLNGSRTPAERSALARKAALAGAAKRLQAAQRARDQLPLAIED